jgi:hypothetical protein
MIPGTLIAPSQDPYMLLTNGYGYATPEQREEILKAIISEGDEVCFVLWKWSNGWRPNSGYDSDKVNAVARMIHANYSEPHRVMCVTDDPAGIDTSVCTPVEMWPRPVINGIDWQKRPNCFHRLRLFDIDHMLQTLGPAKLYWSMDIDVVIRGDFTWLTPICPYTAVAGRHAKYNGSMWALQPGTNRHVWLDFHPVDSPREISKAQHNGKKLVGSDQAWMSLKIPDGDRWPCGEGGPVAQYMDHVHGPELSDSIQLVFFAGSAKPWNFTVKSKCPQLYDTFMRYMDAPRTEH